MYEMVNCDCKWRIKLLMVYKVETGHISETEMLCGSVDDLMV
jgi:hypothetical protein